MINEKPYGYIYLTTNLITSKWYIGKKAYSHRLKKKLTKKELAAITTKGRKPIYKYVEVDSGWQNYYGSSIELKADIEKYGKENFKVEILKECEDKISLGYWEVYYQMIMNVLFENTYNHNINGKWYRNKIK